MNYLFIIAHMSIKQIAKRYDVKTVTVYKWIEQGKINAEYSQRGLMRRIHITMSDLEAFEAKYNITPKL